MPRRVVVTGVGLLSSLGIGTEKSWQGIREARSGVSRIEQFDATAFSCRIAGEVKDFDPAQFIEKKEIKKMGRFIQFGIAASEFALVQSGLKVDAHNAERVGVVIGSGIGGFEVIEREHRNLLEKGPSRISPFFIPATIINLAAGNVSIRIGAKGPNSATATACTTSAHSIGDSFKIIQRDDADVMICGGAEACITPMGIGGFAAMRALSQRNDEPERASRPWDADRDGFVVGEGSGILVLEELEHAKRRGANILAEIVGYGMSGDAYHVTADEVGHSESLVARALASYGADTSQVLVATKSGYLRPGDGTWTLNGSPAYLKSACEASLRRLGVEAIGLYQFHRPDPTVPYEESVGALRDLLDEGKIQMAGISNANPDQIRQAMDVLGGRLVSVQNQFSPAFRSSEPELRLCGELGIAFLPWSPLGGIANAARLGAAQESFGLVGEELGVSPQQVALAWMLALSPVVIPIPGSTRPETIRDSVAAGSLQLTPEQIIRLSDGASSVSTENYEN